jgi:glycosyltransferase involved in cell wall biosynthesis
LDYLKNCVESFLQTKNDNISWQLIIADDNSTDGTKEYLEHLEAKHSTKIIQNTGTGIHRQVNTILKTLSNMTFDLCFKCDDDIQFLQKG